MTFGPICQPRQLGLRQPQHKDDGIWEVRGGQQHFVYSKMMRWVAVDRTHLGQTVFPG